MTHERHLMRWSLVALGSVLALFFATVWSAEHFPQQYAREFYTVKAVVGMSAVALTVIHMDRTWHTLRSGAQMSRYIMLLFGTTVAGAGSFEQISDGALVEIRNMGGMEFLAGVCVAMVWSLREDRRTRLAKRGLGLEQA